MTKKTIDDAKIMHVRVETRIEGDPARVWEAMTREIGAWWPDAFYAGGEPGAREMQLDVEPGGKLFESWDDGGWLLWGTLVSVSPGRKLEFTGVTFPQWGGPNLMLGAWEVEPDGDGANVRVTESTIGRVSDEAAREKEKGWRFLFDGALKAHVEGRDAPAWE